MKNEWREQEEMAIAKLRDFSYGWCKEQKYILTFLALPFLVFKPSTFVGEIFQDRAILKVVEIKFMLS